MMVKSWAQVEARSLCGSLGTYGLYPGTHTLVMEPLGLSAVRPVLEASPHSGGVSGRHSDVRIRLPGVQNPLVPFTVSWGQGQGPSPVIPQPQVSICRAGRVGDHLTQACEALGRPTAVSGP